MSRGLSESPPPSSFNSIFEPLPFYTTLHYQEVLATLRYGIVTRKGLMLLTGDAGVGKSTLLDQLARVLDSHVDCIVRSDADLSFADLLRLVLDDLEISDCGADVPSMLQRCKDVLHSRLATGQVVALLIDNAEALACETLEQVLNHFYSAAPGDPDENLLQIVLAGRPELMNHLVQARLHSVIARSEIVCQLQPLRDKDVAGYLATRLRAANLPEDAFTKAAIDQLAVYSEGNPSLINAISNRALQVGDGSPVLHVSAEMVVHAGRSLGLFDRRRPVDEPFAKNFDIPIGRAERFRPPEEDMTEVVCRTFRNSSSDLRRSWLWSALPSQKAIVVMGIVLCIAAAGAWLQTKAEKNNRSNSLARPDEIAASQPIPDSNPDAAPLVKQELSAERVQGSEIPALQTQPSTTPGHPLAGVEKSAEGASLAAEKAADKPPVTGLESAPSKVPAPAKENPAQPLENPALRRRILEAQVHRAIDNRAIIGVTVSVIGNIVYLDGEVATEGQRNAAVRAAQRAAGEDRVLNRITVAGS